MLYEKVSIIPIYIEVVSDIEMSIVCAGISLNIMSCYNLFNAPVAVRVTRPSKICYTLNDVMSILCDCLAQPMMKHA